MFVVPFVLRKSLPSLIQWKLQPVLLFLENHGKQLCSAEEPVQWLEENGFAVKRAWVEKTIYFAEVDETQTEMKDFYSFEQLTKQQKKGTEECWRTFYMMVSPPDEKGSEKAWNEGLDEPFTNVLLSIASK
jgi:hypothetical protein